MSSQSTRHDDPEVTPGRDSIFGGKRFYTPEVIAAYCVVFLPVGLLLYGLNVMRRGNRIMGWLLSALSSAWFALLIVFVAVYGRTGALGFIGIFVGIGLLRMEGGPYRHALARGGKRASWWPPLLWSLGAVVAGVLITELF